MKRLSSSRSAQGRLRCVKNQGPTMPWNTCGTRSSAACECSHQVTVINPCVPVACERWTSEAAFGSSASTRSEKAYRMRHVSNRVVYTYAWCDSMAAHVANVCTGSRGECLRQQRHLTCSSVITCKQMVATNGNQGQKVTSNSKAVLSGNHGLRVLRYLGTRWPGQSAHGALHGRQCR